MSYKEYTEKLSAIAVLAKKCATGPPLDLANRLDVSEKTARRMVNHLRQQGNKIRYCRVKQSYILT